MKKYKVMVIVEGNDTDIIKDQMKCLLSDIGIVVSDYSCFHKIEEVEEIPQ